jgi:hypothetical protein
MIPHAAVSGLAERTAWRGFPQASYPLGIGASHGVAYRRVGKRALGIGAAALHDRAVPCAGGASLEVCVS